MTKRHQSRRQRSRVPDAPKDAERVSLHGPESTEVLRGLVAVDPADLPDDDEKEQTMAVPKNAPGRPRLTREQVEARKKEVAEAVARGLPLDDFVRKLRERLTSGK